MKTIKRICLLTTAIPAVLLTVSLPACDKKSPASQKTADSQQTTTQKEEAISAEESRIIAQRNAADLLSEDKVLARGVQDHFRYAATPDEVLGLIEWLSSSDERKASCARDALVLMDDQNVRLTLKNLARNTRIVAVREQANEVLRRLNCEDLREDVRNCLAATATCQNTASKAEKAAGAALNSVAQLSKSLQESGKRMDEFDSKLNQLHQYQEESDNKIAELEENLNKAIAEFKAALANYKTIPSSQPDLAQETYEKVIDLQRKGIALANMYQQEVDRGKSLQCQIDQLRAHRKQVNVLSIVSNKR